MDVVLPSNGCNILTSDVSFYNYSSDGRTRQRYYIYDGVAHLQQEDYSQYGYTYTGTCLSTGDLVYKPEYKDVLFPAIAFIAFLFILWLVYRIVIKRLLP